VSIALSSGASLVGTVSSVYADRVVRVIYSKLAPKHRLRAWVQLLALCAQWPERSWEAVTVGRGKRDGVVVTSRLAGPPGTDALAHLEDLVEVYRAGLNIPLPLPPKAASAYAAKRRAGVTVKNAESFAANAWRSGSGPNQMGEFTDTHHQRVWGDVNLTALLEIPPDPSDADWPNEPHRFGQLARAVWTPLLDAETVTQ
jgi:exodeoxyribonuclease V gamma subunit